MPRADPVESRYYVALRVMQQLNFKNLKIEGVLDKIMYNLPRFSRLFICFLPKRGKCFFFCLNKLIKIFITCSNSQRKAFKSLKLAMLSHRDEKIKQSRKIGVYFKLIRHYSQYFFIQYHFEHANGPVTLLVWAPCAVSLSSFFVT